jgi:hypothetical protein
MKFCPNSNDATISNATIRDAFTLLAAVVAMTILGTPDCHAQGDLKIAPSKTVTVTTRDGVVIRCRYYAGGVVKSGVEDEFEKRDGKEVMPLVLIHGYEEQGSVYDELAKLLQADGHAVIVPDLRGHGQSTRTLNNILLDAEKMKARDFGGLLFDLSAVKKFLLAENNEEKLNIELLTVIGAEMGAAAAVNWTVKDWSLPQLIGFKQGRDVKALVLLSPEIDSKGLGFRDLLKNRLIQQMPMFVAYGTKDSDARKDVELMTKQIERNHKGDPTSYQVMKLNTSVQGTKLIAKGSPVPAEIKKFVSSQIFSKASGFPWTDRKSPLASDD